jgi:hypothetical protein
LCTFKDLPKLLEKAETMERSAHEAWLKAGLRPLTDGLAFSGWRYWLDTSGRFLPHFKILTARKPHVARNFHTRCECLPPTMNPVIMFAIKAAHWAAK